jgi:excisionase family DNA binding protein
MNDNETSFETIVLKFSGEIHVSREQIQPLLDRFLTKTESPKSAPSVPIPAPSKADPFKGRLMFTPKETAEILRISQKSVYRLIARGLLKTSKALRHIKIPKAEIEQFVKTQSE